MDDLGTEEVEPLGAGGAGDGGVVVADVGGAGATGVVPGMMAGFALQL